MITKVSLPISVLSKLERGCLATVSLEMPGDSGVLCVCVCVYVCVCVCGRIMPLCGTAVRHLVIPSGAKN